MSEFRVLGLDGRVPYRAGLAWQRDVAERRIEGELDEDLLVLLEHEPVLTLGRNAREDHVTAGPERLERLGVDRVEVERGGDVTYHGPGQLVGYPIFDLRDHRKDLHWFLRRIEGALIRTIAAFGLDGFRVEGHTGVWVGEPEGDVAEEDAPPLVADGRVRKVASIGIHVSRWVSWHGFALNVTREPLENFRLIVPCGIRGVRVTSLAAEGVDADLPAVRRAAAAGFEEAFGASGAAVGRDLRASLPPLPGASSGGRPGPGTGSADGAPAQRTGPGRSGDGAREEIEPTTRSASR